jgi:hypothetical protein
VERLEQGASVLVLRDAAPSLGIAGGASTLYRVEIVDDAGRRLAERTELKLTGGSMFPVRLPPAGPAYVVVRVWAFRSRAPRPMEVHLVHEARQWKIVGIVH